MLRLHPQRLPELIHAGLYNQFGDSTWRLLADTLTFKFTNDNSVGLHTLTENQLTRVGKAGKFALVVQFPCLRNYQKLHRDCLRCPLDKHAAKKGCRIGVPGADHNSAP